MILFPTQKETYDKLQLLPGHKNDCGRTGVNGGYAENPETKYGVNCYGKKPDGLDPSPQSVIKEPSKEDIEKEVKIKYWKDNRDTLLLDSFNKTKWSEY
jgi:hypothetical protein